MCRLLAVSDRRPFDLAPHLQVFAEIARTSPQYQGHGWGCAWWDSGTWRVYRNIRPVWEDRLDAFPATTAFVAHARSAFQDEGIAVENNMPFVESGAAFIFNGELRGVRIAETGRIGAEKLFRFLLRNGAAISGGATSIAVERVRRRTRYVRAMNLVLARHGAFHVSSSFAEDEDYFTLHVRRSGERTIVCSAPYPGEAGWTALANHTTEVLAW